MRTLAVAIAVLVSAVTAQKAISPCKYTYTDPKATNPSFASATWDVTNLYDKNFDYVATDPRNEQQNMYQYEFVYNICGNVNNPPTACPPSGPKYSAYQVSNPNVQGLKPVCYILGPDLTNKNLPGPSFDLMHSYDPAYGFTMSVPSFQATCPSNPSLKYNLKLAFMCADVPTVTAKGTQNGENMTAIVYEAGSGSCDAEVHIFGRAGCPSQCPIANGKLCGGRGICGYDATTHQARCMCDDGWLESNCLTPLDPIPVGGIVGAVFGGLFMGVGAIGAFWYFRIRNQAPRADASMGDGYYEASE